MNTPHKPPCGRVTPVFSRREMLLSSGAGFGALALSYLLRDNPVAAQTGPSRGSARRPQSAKCFFRNADILRNAVRASGESAISGRKWKLCVMPS